MSAKTEISLRPHSCKALRKAIIMSELCNQMCLLTIIGLSLGLPEKGEMWVSELFSGDSPSVPWSSARSRAENSLSRLCRPGWSVFTEMTNTNNITAGLLQMTGLFLFGRNSPEDVQADKIRY